MAVVVMTVMVMMMMMMMWTTRIRQRCSIDGLLLCPWTNSYSSVGTASHGFKCKISAINNQFPNMDVNFLS